MGGKGEGGNPTQQCAPAARIRGMGGDTRTQQHGTPPRDRKQEPEGGTHRALTSKDPGRGRTEKMVPPERSRALNVNDLQEEGRGSSMRPQRAVGARGDPRTHQHGTPLQDQAQDEEGVPQPQKRVKTARGQEGAGDRPCAPTARGPSPDKGGDP